MAHDRDHSGESYYLDQLCTIGVCGAIGVVMFLLWFWGGLNIFLHPKFHPAVLIGGLALLGLVLLRSVSVWIAVGREKKAKQSQPACDSHHHGACEHNHGHDRASHSHAHGNEVHSHGHDHGTHSHAHDRGHSHGNGADHGHDHGWAPWRYAILLLPVVLFLLNVPPRAMDAEESAEEEGLRYLSFSQVEQAAKDAQAREDFKGQRGHLKGLCNPMDERTFGLMRIVGTCCAADAVPVDLKIRTRDDLPKPKMKDFAGQWVQVTGEVQFQKTNQGYKTVLVVDGGYKITSDHIKAWIDDAGSSRPTRESMSNLLEPLVDRAFRSEEELIEALEKKWTKEEMDKQKSEFDKHKRDLLDKAVYHKIKLVPEDKRKFVF